MERYTLETLSEVNPGFTRVHWKINHSDVDMVNEFIELIEKSRSSVVPMPGDIVQYTNEYGEFFASAHIETVENGIIHLCERANTYISKSEENGISCSSSGGTWNHVEIDKFKYIGTMERRFWHFGHCGACADGGIDFYATVNVWKCNINKEPFSTRTHDKYYLSYSDRKDSDYRYFASQNGMSSHAWRTEKELQAWLRTHRAVINGNIAWTYKEVEHHISPQEYDKLDAIEDVMQMNGKRRCKRIYDDESSTIHTYFVWYWNDPTMEDYSERYARQNEIRKQYELNYTAVVNSYAMEELKSGKVKPIKVDF